jgi:glycosyltransferase involved in cell wall biosynthesis
VFRIITPFFNAGSLLDDNVRMLRRQSWRDFHCVLVDDCSTDDSANIVRAAIAGDSRFDLVSNTVKHYALGNAVQAISRLRPASDDVIVLLDGDDRLFAADALERVAAVYGRHDCWLTYGSFTGYDDGLRDPSCAPYAPEVIRANRFRRADWRASHLKTFRAHLWAHVDEVSLRTTDEELRRVMARVVLTGRVRVAWQMARIRAADLLDPTGRWFRRCYDKAVMYPLLELAGEHARFVPDVLYRYNPARRRGQARSAQLAQRATRAVLTERPPLEPLVAEPYATACTPTGTDSRPVPPITVPPHSSPAAR